MKCKKCGEEQIIGFHDVTDLYEEKEMCWKGHGWIGNHREEFMAIGYDELFAHIKRLNEKQAIEIHFWVSM